MPAPVIDETVSILAYRKGEYFVYQPAALNTPTGWTASALPAGLTFNTSTGRISGAGTEPGVYNVTLTATNADGSDQLIITIGIEAVAFNTDAGIEVDVDLSTGKVSNPASGNGEPIIYAKRGDKLIVSVGFKKGNHLTQISLEQLDIAIKEFEPEPILVLTDGMFTQTGDYDTTRFQCVLFMDPAKLTAPLSAYEGDKETYFDAVAEIRWSVIYLIPGETDPTGLERSSRNFTIRIDRDITPDL